MNEPKPKDLKINNVGYQFNPMQKPVYNFAINGPVNFTAAKKKTCQNPIGAKKSNVKQVLRNDEYAHLYSGYKALARKLFLLYFK